MKYNAKKDPCGKVGISIVRKGKFKGGVYLDLSGGVIDMRKGAGTSILIDGVEDVTIVNGKFKNSGDPGDVPIAGTPTFDYLEVPQDISQAQPAQQMTLSGIMAAPADQFVWVTAVDPYSGVGIAVHKSSGIVIKNCNFDHMYLGIAVISTSLDPTQIDVSRDITIKNCTGSQFGYLKPGAPTSYGPPMDTRGALIAFQAAQFLGPSTATPFYYGNYNTVTGVADLNAEYPIVFQNITIENCNGGSEFAEAGIFLNYTNSTVVRNCNMRVPTLKDIINKYYNVNSITTANLGAYAQAAFLGYFNHALRMEGCAGQGGFFDFFFNFGFNEMFLSCTAQYHYNTGILILYSQYDIVNGCKVSEGLDLGIPLAISGDLPIPLAGVGYAIEFLASYYGVVENNSLSNYRGVSPIKTTNNYPAYNSYQDAIGMTTSISSWCQFINNSVFNNGTGIGAYPTDNCTYAGNTIWGNGVDKEQGGLTVGLQSVGIVVSDDYISGPPLPLDGDPMRGNKYYGNRMYNNGQFGNSNVVVSPDSPMYSIGMPFLITSVFQNPLLPIPVNANIQETPSIYLTYDANTVTLIENTGIDYFLGLGYPETYAIYAGISTINFIAGATVTMDTYVWQGMASSTVPIKEYTLHTPGRGNIGPQASPNFTLTNIQSTDVGYYHVTVHFDIGDLPSPPALKHYKSNKLTLDRILPA